jgi:hypothetical protein
MKWTRGVSQLGDKGNEGLIQERLEQRWPASGYPVHIDVVGASDTTAVSVQVWNATDIKIIEKAYPEDYVGAAHPTAQAAIAKLEEIINRLREDQKV